MRNILLILLAFIAAVTFIRAFEQTEPENTKAQALVQPEETGR
jgi:hypothetical protein